MKRETNERSGRQTSVPGKTIIALEMSLKSLPSISPCGEKPFYENQNRKLATQSKWIKAISRFSPSKNQSNSK